LHYTLDTIEHSEFLQTGESFNHRGERRDAEGADKREIFSPLPQRSLRLWALSDSFFKSVEASLFRTLPGFSFYLLAPESDKV
jgi:hypothetical protein